MTQACELHKIHPSLYWWSAYEPEVKCDLASSAYLSLEGWVLVDPILLSPEHRETLQKIAPFRSIFLTNENHSRSSEFYRKEYKLPIYASASASQKLDISVDHLFSSPLLHDLHVIPIPGATEGETCFIAPEGMAILGDALLNLPNYEFVRLPLKYSWNDEKSKESLSQLLDYPLEIMTFAHGSPVRGEIHKRLQKIL